MIWNIPADIAIFAVVVLGFFAVGLPTITSKVFVPRRVQFECVADHELTPAQTNYFARLDPKLLELGYRPMGNRVPTNMQGGALLRLYLSDADPAMILMNLLASEVEGARKHAMNYLEIVTRYADGTVLSTRNAELSEVLDILPEHIIQERRGIREPSKLKSAHDRKAEDLRLRGPLFTRADEFEEKFHDHHERWCRHQIDRGLLTEVPDDKERLRPTIKAGLRGIANFLNPYADNFTPLRLLLSLIFGLAVPAAAVLWLSAPGSRLIEWMSQATPLDPATCLVACLFLVATFVGIVIGMLFTGKAFIWSFLLTYVLLRIMVPLGLGVLVALGLWTGVVAHWTARWRERRQTLV